MRARLTAVVRMSSGGGHTRSVGGSISSVLISSFEHFDLHRRERLADRRRGPPCATRVMSNTLWASTGSNTRRFSLLAALRSRRSPSSMLQLSTVEQSSIRERGS